MIVYFCDGIKYFVPNNTQQRKTGEKHLSIYDVSSIRWTWEGWGPTTYKLETLA